MSDLATILLDGVSLGSMYALLALGIVLVFTVSGVLNFAQPATIALGAYGVAALHEAGIAFGFAVVIAAATAAVVNALLDVLLVQRFQRRGEFLAASIMTVGLSVILLTAFQARVGARILPVGDPFGSSLTSFHGVTIANARIAAVAAAIVLLGALYLLIRRTMFGLHLRAAADNREAAQLVGVHSGRISMVVWAASGALAVVGGTLLAAYPSPGVSSGAADIAMRALPAALIGGLASTSGAIIGGLLVGLTEATFLQYQSSLEFLGTGFATVAPYAVMLVVIVLRPRGLLGSQEVHRA